MANAELERLRRRARHATLFPPLGLGAAIARMGFVQADPIRAPARAQDLILRHRVAGYRAGDLDRGFARLGLEEDFLHAYGFMPAPTRHLLHPRPDPDSPTGVHQPQGLAAAVLEFVRAGGPTHPRALAARFGRDRETNAWGGFSSATTRAMDELRHYGLLRVAMRQDGIRIYAAAPPAPEAASGPERARAAVLLLAGILGPVSAPSLRGALALMARHNPGLGPLVPHVAAALRDGALEREEVDGEAYLCPPAQVPGPEKRDVRLLAPFDPLVWDRRRFEHLHGWAYRFEAYTPPARRQLGYYALPLLWGDTAVGWANVAAGPAGLRVAPGYAGRPPDSLVFRRALEAELGRFERFLAPRAQPR